MRHLLLALALFSLPSFALAHNGSHAAGHQHDKSGNALVQDGGSRPDPNAPGVTIGGPFTLLDQTGKAVTEKDYFGKYVIVFFGFTHCPDICPTGLQTVVDAKDALGPLGEKIQPVFITLDPERDTPPVMAEYVDMFASNIIGLTGSMEQIQAVASSYKVSFRKEPTEDGADYEIDHSAPIYLMGPDGAFITLYGSDITGEDLATDLKARLEASK